MPLEDIINIFKSKSIEQFRPESQEHLNFEYLDQKSTRILKRLLVHLSDLSTKNNSKNEFNKFMDGLMSTQLVQTSSSNAEVELFSA